jgi:hypothetical protein
MRKILNPLVADYLSRSATRLFNAAQSGDVEFAEAVLRELKNNIDEYIQQLHEG